MTSMALRDRVESYGRAFPRWPPLRADDRWIDGMWVLGNDYRSRTGYYGAYPPNYLSRLLSLFPDVVTSDTLHLFAGSLGDDVLPAMSVDINPALRPRVACDAQALPFQDGEFGFVVADTPYSKSDAEKYGTPMPNRRLVLREAARVVRPGGFLAWLDTQLPMFRKVDWHWFGAIGVIRSTNHRVRLLSLFERARLTSGQLSLFADLS